MPAGGRTDTMCACACVCMFACPCPCPCAWLQVCDLGLARHKHGAFLQTVHQGGTLSYVAPEVHRGGDIDERYESVCVFGAMGWWIACGDTVPHTPAAVLARLFFFAAASAPATCRSPSRFVQCVFARMGLVHVYIFLSPLQPPTQYRHCLGHPLLNIHRLNTITVFSSQKGYNHHRSR